MIQTEGIRLTGKIIATLTSPSGVRKEERVYNTVTTVGKTTLAAWLAAASQAGEFFTYLAVGLGTAAPAAGDTALGSEVATRVDGVLSSSTNVWQNLGTFAAANPGSAVAITEAGLFNASTTGTILARGTFAAINKATADSLALTWQITYS